MKLVHWNLDCKHSYIRNAQMDGLHAETCMPLVDKVVAKR
jgi:hypothetical protein